MVFTGSETYHITARLKGAIKAKLKPEDHGIATQSSQGDDNGNHGEGYEDVELPCFRFSEGLSNITVV